MKINSRKTIKITGLILFLLSALGMFYFGYKTFYVKTEDHKVADYAYHFAMIGEEEGDPYWESIYQGAKLAAEKDQINLEYIAPKKANDEEALALLDRMISAKVDGIMTYGMAGQRFVDLMLKASERNLPVITIETDLKSSVRKGFVGIDNFKIGEDIAEDIIKKRGASAQIAAVVSSKNVQSQKERLAGLRHYLEVHGSPLQLLTVEASGYSDIGAATATYNIFKSNPEVTDVIGLSSLEGEGIIEGLKDIVMTHQVNVYSFYNKTVDDDALDEKISLTEIKYDQAELSRKAVEMLKEFQAGDQLHHDQLIEFELEPKS